MAAQTHGHQSLAGDDSIHEWGSLVKFNDVARRVTHVGQPTKSCLFHLARNRRVYEGIPELNVGDSPQKSALRDLFLCMATLKRHFLLMVTSLVTYN